MTVLFQNNKTKILQKSNFLPGVASGFLGSLGASGFGLIAGEKFAGSLVGNIGFGALAGGVGAELTGGNFWQGAITGGIVAGLNHAMHKMAGPGDPPKKKTQWDLNKDGKISLGEANQHWKSGKGEQIFVEANSVDLNFLDITGWEAGKDYNVQTLFGSREGRVFGNIRVHYLGDNKVSIYPDVYDFDQHGKFMSSPVRNTANSIGRWVAGEGQPFKINFVGVNKITHYITPTRIYP